MSATTTDRYELPLTTESPAAADHYVEGIDRFLAQIYGPELAFAQAIEADDGLAIAHAADALLTMYRNDMPGAKQKVARAKTLAVNATRRERQHVDAINLMIEGDNRKTLRLIREHLAEFPRDMLMVRLANRLLILGCSGAGIPNFPDELLAMLKTLKPDYGDDWAFLGQYAFAHHETGYFDDSLRYAPALPRHQAGQRQRLTLRSPRLLRDRRPRRRLRFPWRLARRIRQSRTLQRTPILAPGPLPARHRTPRKRRHPLRRPHQAHRHKEKHRLPRRQRLPHLAHEDIRRRSARPRGRSPARSPSQPPKNPAPHSETPTPPSASPPEDTPTRWAA